MLNIWFTIFKNRVLVLILHLKSIAYCKCTEHWSVLVLLKIYQLVHSGCYAIGIYLTIYKPPNFNS